MEAARLHLANGMVRIVKGCSADVGAALKKRSLGGEDDRIRQFIDLDGEALSINADAILMVEAASAEAKVAKSAFGFARALEA